MEVPAELDDRESERTGTVPRQRRLPHQISALEDHDHGAIMPRGVVWNVGSAGVAQQTTLIESPEMAGRTASQAGV